MVATTIRIGSDVRVSLDFMTSSPRRRTEGITSLRRRFCVEVVCAYTGTRSATISGPAGASHVQAVAGTACSYDELQLFPRIDELREARMRPCDHWGEFQWSSLLAVSVSGTRGTPLGEATLVCRPSLLPLGACRTFTPVRW